MKDNVIKFTEMVQQDEELKAKLENIQKQFKDAPKTDETQEKIIAAIIPIAKEKGLDIEPEDFRPEEGEISDAELANVAGGDCYCLVAGGGGGTDAQDGKTYGCACVSYGQGGDGSIDDFNCLCAMSGIGDDSDRFKPA